MRSGNPPDVAQLAGNDTFMIAATGKLGALGAYLDGTLKTELNPDATSGPSDCSVERHAERIALVTPSARVDLSDAQAAVVRQADAVRVTIGIRAECLALASESEKRSAEVVVRGTVQVVKMLGAEQHVHVATDGGALTARVPTYRTVRVDDTVTFAAAARDVHGFERDDRAGRCADPTPNGVAAAVATGESAC